MNQTAINHLNAELAHAGEDTQLSPGMLLLEQLRITPDRQLPRMDFLFTFFGTPCFPRRELVAITGKAKSGKTFVTSMLMSCCHQRDVLCFHRESDKPLRVLWYDTEQSDESTQDIMKNRIKIGRTPTPALKPTPDPSPREGGKDTTAVGAPLPSGGDGGGFDGSDGFDVFNVRVLDWQQRRSLLAEAIVHCHPDLVVVDGIRDLVNDINDGVLAQEVMEELLHLATRCECCIVCVLHQNKSGEDNNLRGWIGTELMNKAFEVYACEKLMPQRIFKLEQTLTRKYDIDRPLYFEVGSDGLPMTCAMPAGDGDRWARDKELRPQLNHAYIVHDEAGQWEFDVMRLFTDALRGENEVQAQEFRKRVMELGNIVVYSTYNELLGKALDKRIIQKVKHDGHFFYQPTPF